MDGSHIHAAHVVYTQVLGVGDRPFPKLTGIRPVWQPVFSDKRCFSHLTSLTRDYPANRDQMHGEDAVSLPTKPFLPGLGSFCFSGRSGRMAGNRDAWKRSGTSINASMRGERFGDEPHFGYDPAVPDERMSCLYFELCRPVFLRAIGGTTTRVQGKIFLHLYPSGYIVLRVAIALAWTESKSIQDVHHDLVETRPWRRTPQWQWSSRLGSGSLPDIMAQIYDSLHKALYEDPRLQMVDAPWRSAVKVAVAREARLDPRALEDLPYDLLWIGKEDDKDYKCMAIDRNPSVPVEFQRSLLATRQGIVLVVPPKSELQSFNRRNVTRFFWRILTLDEHLALKRRIYDDYTRILNQEIPKMRDDRLGGLIRRFTKREDLLRYSVYNSDLPAYVAALDRYVQQDLMPEAFNRKLYAEIEAGDGFTKRRKEFGNLIKDWDTEVEKWTPFLVQLWKQIIAPLKSLIPKAS